jgi:hypothetical protein
MRYPDFEWENPGRSGTRKRGFTGMNRKDGVSEGQKNSLGTTSTARAGGSSPMDEAISFHHFKSPLEFAMDFGAISLLLILDGVSRTPHIDRVHAREISVSFDCVTCCPSICLTKTYQNCQ